MTAKQFVVLMLVAFAVVLAFLATLAFGGAVIHGWSDGTDHALFAGGFVCLALAIFIEHFPARA